MRKRHNLWLQRRLKLNLKVKHTKWQELLVSQGTDDFSKDPKSSWEKEKMILRENLCITSKPHSAFQWTCKEQGGG